MTSPKELAVDRDQSTEGRLIKQYCFMIALVGSMCIFPACIESQLDEGPISDVSVTKSPKLCELW